jgi:prepilin-type N-terminal cleavage/methylation domain-containing protein
MKLKKGEKGFTLIELLVAITTLVFITGAASMTITTMMRLTPKTNNWAVALRQVQDAGYWISRDVLMSDNITVGAGNPTFLTLTQPQAQPPSKTVVYQFQDMSGGLKRLMRTDNATTMMIAQYISPNTTAIPTDNHTLTLTIEAIFGSATVSRQYKAAQRVPAPSP